MIGNSELTSFFLVAVLYAFMPGPAMLYSIAQTVSGGRKVGLYAAFGLHIGGYFHVFLAALGLSAILLTQPSLYTALQKVGAVYLIYLGVKRIYDTWHSDEEAVRPTHTIEPKRTLLDSIIVDILNPKAALFYLAFLPQFADPNGQLTVWVQILLLGVATNILFSTADVLSVLLSDKLQKTFNGKNQKTTYIRWAGFVFIILGLLIFLRK